ncbi:hypothetical protein IAQ61_005059 [Plenodomus lingam]|uniref:uncharacterized protein n=1 Tax=Leptosphaeria maculans TaxID=5022 RepID=UPI00332AF0FF|nr:hypothetical protein IAQ61_005059 [Plenodomus lingam]
MEPREKWLNQCAEKSPFALKICSIQGQGNVPLPTPSSSTGGRATMRSPKFDSGLIKSSAPFDTWDLPLILSILLPAW